MRPAHVPGPDGLILRNNWTPIIGRLAKVGLGFLLSVRGWPVAGSMGSRSHTTFPQTATPQEPTCIRACPFSVSQTPDGTDCAWADPQPSKPMTKQLTIRGEIFMPDISMGGFLVGLEGMRGCQRTGVILA